METRRALPGDPNLEQSRYIEAAICGILVGNIYAPNGNPRPGPKFDYKLAWLGALSAHAQELLDSTVPRDLMGDFNVIPTDEDVYSLNAGAKDALFAPEARESTASWSRKARPTPSAISCRTSGSTPSGTIGGIR